MLRSHAEIQRRSFRAFALILLISTAACFRPIHGYSHPGGFGFYASRRGVRTWRVRFEGEGAFWPENIACAMAILALENGFDSFEVVTHLDRRGDSFWDVTMSRGTTGNVRRTLAACAESVGSKSGS